MDGEEDLEFAIYWNRISMHVVGLWPHAKDKSQYSDFKFMLTVMMVLAFFNFPQTADLFYYEGNLDRIVENLMTNVGAFLTVVKLIVVRYHKEALSSLLHCVIEDWMSPKSVEDREGMVKTATLHRRICKFCIALGYLITLMFLVARVYLNILIGRADGTGFAKELLYVGRFPFDTQISPYFEFTFIGQSLACGIAFIAYTCVDSFLATLVIHLCGQLSNLRRALKNLADGSAKNPTEYWNTLGFIVQRHRKLHKFSETLENAFNYMLLSQLMACTIMFVMEGFRMVMTLVESRGQAFPIVELAFFLVHMSYVQFHLFIYCYVGEMLLGESKEVCDACYMSEWYNLSTQQARALIMVMCQSKLPLHITAGKFGIFSYVLFTNVWKSSMGYLSVLLAVKDNSGELE